MFCFVFFFKQKTAYEMRISDWSSDVCSSDLSTIAASLRIWQPNWGSGSIGSHASSGLRSMRSIALPAIATNSAFCLTAGSAPTRLPLLLTGQIGRAAGRERVCQSLVVLGGSRIIKKKTQNKTQYTTKN